MTSQLFSVGQFFRIEDYWLKHTVALVLKEMVPVNCCTFLLQT